MSIKNVIFDIGRVLIGYEWMDFVNSVFDEETAQAVTRAVWRTGYWHELDKAILTDDEILELFYSAEPDYKEDIKYAFDHVGKCVLRRDYASDWIESVKSKGYKVYFLSNYSHHLMNANPEALDFLTHMDGGVFSCDVRVIKPDPEIYKILFEKYGLIPEECLFIDDQEPNVLKARELGMAAVQYIDYEQARAETDRLPALR